jgi:hypothetical protein
MVKHEVMVRKSRNRAMSENDGNVHPVDQADRKSELADAKLIAGPWGYKSIGRASKYQAEPLETQQITYTEDQLPDFVPEQCVPVPIVPLLVDKPLVVAEMLDGIAEVVEVPRDVDIVGDLPSIMATCNDAPVIDDYAQIGTVANERSSDILATSAESNERPKLPFSLNGRLVGTRHYGPAIVQGVKKPTEVVVFDDDIQPVDAAASTCVLL